MILQLGDEGTVLIVQFMKRDESNKLVPEDISTIATGMNICLESPTPVTKVLAAAFDTDGRDGKIKATTVAGTLDVAGTWKIAGQITGTSLNRRTRYRVFTVETPVCP